MTRCNAAAGASVVTAFLLAPAPAAAQLLDPEAVRAAIEQMIGDALVIDTGDRSDDRIEQTGLQGRAFIGQAGSGNRADVAQDGFAVGELAEPNMAVIGQAGADGQAQIFQRGSGNLAGITQDGSTRLAAAAIDQSGSVSIAAVSQVGLGGASQVVQGGGLFGLGAHVALVRQIDGSASQVSQSGSDHLVLVDQAGFGNSSDVLQRDLGSEAGDEMILTAGIFQTGEDHRSELRQDADGAGAFASAFRSAGPSCRLRARARRPRRSSTRRRSATARSSSRASGRPDRSPMSNSKAGPAVPASFSTGRTWSPCSCSWPEPSRPRPKSCRARVGATGRTWYRWRNRSR